MTHKFDYKGCAVEIFTADDKNECTGYRIRQNEHIVKDNFDMSTTVYDGIGICVDIVDDYLKNSI
jgi:hypothetical protein